MAADTPAKPDFFWSEDPREKIVQLSHQLKIARGLVDKKSDMCDELADQLRGLQEDVEERDDALRDARANLSSVNAELRATTRVNESERSEQHEELATLQGEFGDTQQHFKTAKLALQEETACITRITESESEALRNAAELEATVVQLERQVADEMFATQTSLSELGDCKKAFDSELLEVRTEYSNQCLHNVSNEALLSAARSEEHTMMANLNHVETQVQALRESLDELRSASRLTNDELQSCRGKLITAEDDLVKESQESGDKISRLEEYIHEEDSLSKVEDTVRKNKLSEEVHHATEHLQDEIQAGKNTYTEVKLKLAAEISVAASESSAVDALVEEMRSKESAWKFAMDEQHLALEKQREEAALELQRLQVEGTSQHDHFEESLRRSQEALHDELKDETAQACELETTLASCREDSEVEAENHALALSMALELRDEQFTTFVAEWKSREEALEKRYADELKAAQEQLKESQTLIGIHAEEAAQASSCSASALAAAEQRQSSLERQLVESKENEEALQSALQNEKELHNASQEMVQQLQANSADEAKELSHELEQLSNDLEEKEEEIMNIKFEMVRLQNDLKDQVDALEANSEELDIGRILLIEKDEKLQHAIKRQSELVGQMNEATSRLQEKVSQLSRELEASHTAYKALEQQTQAVIERLEHGHANLKTQLDSVHSERVEASFGMEAAESECRAIETKLHEVAKRATEAEAEIDVITETHKAEHVDMSERLEAEHLAHRQASEEARFVLVTEHAQFREEVGAMEAELTTARVTSQNFEEEGQRQNAAWQALLQKTETEAKTELNLLEEKLAHCTLEASQKHCELEERLSASVKERESLASAERVAESQFSEAEVVSSAKASHAEACLADMKDKAADLENRCQEANQYHGVLAQELEDQLEAHRSAMNLCNQRNSEADETQAMIATEIAHLITAMNLGEEEQQRARDNVASTCCHLEQEHEVVRANLSTELQSLETELETVRHNSDLKARELNHVRESQTSWQQESESHLQEIEELQELAGAYQARQVEEGEKIWAETQQHAHELREAKAQLHAVNLERTEAKEKVLQLEKQTGDQQAREASLIKQKRLDAEQVWSLQERLVTSGEQLQACEVRVRDLEKALERSRLLERQAVERVQELRMSLALLREFGREDFMKLEPSPAVSNKPIDSSGHSQSVETAAAIEESFGPELTSVLIAIELNLGNSTATLTVAPWQTRADFATVVDAFLKEHKLRPVFAGALLEYLEELEAEATSFPVTVKASLSEIFSTHG